MQKESGSAREKEGTSDECSGRARKHVSWLEKALNAYLRRYTSGDRMIFIILAKLRKKPTKESMAQANKLFERMVREGSKIIGQYWTLGRYDTVNIIEGKDEKSAMKALMRWGDMISTETLVAVTREDAIKLLE
jgi:uncharacterized protein with GYD domain